MFIEPDRKRMFHLLGMGLFLLILVLICTFKPVRIIWDSQGYVERYRHLDLGETGSEPLSYFLLYITRPFDSYFVMFFVYALLSVGMKLWAIWRSSALIFPSILIFIATTYLIQDIIQIRVAVASGFLMFSIPYVVNRNFCKFLLCVIVATLFHYSAVAWLCIYWLGLNSISKIWFWGILICYVLSMLGLRIAKFIEFIPIDIVQTLYAAYTSKLEQGIFNYLNIFSIIQIIKIIILFFVFLKIDILVQKSRYAILLTKIASLSIMCFVMLADIPVVATRIAELFQISFILLIPLLAYVFKGKSIGKFFIIMIGVLFLLNSILTRSLLVK